MFLSRFIFIFLFLVNPIFAYKSCLDKVKDSNSIRYNSLYIPVKNHKLLVYSKTKPIQKIYKYDKFLSLYLVKDDSGFLYRFELSKKSKNSSYIITNTRAKKGKIISHQVGLNRLGRYSLGVSSYPAILSDSCCYLEGIVTNRGVIERDYIKRFLNSKDIFYADIGLRVRDRDGVVVVDEVNPFFDVKLKVGDTILRYDGMKVYSSSYFMKKVLFSKLYTTHNFLVKRGSKKLHLRVKTKKRDGGGDVSDTFLETKGLFFDKDLKIKSLTTDIYGLKVLDKLILVNGVSVKTQKDVRKNLSLSKPPFSLLFERDNFQFFVKIK